MGLNSNMRPTPPGPAPTYLEATPSASELVTYLNNRTAGINSLESRDLDLELKADGQSGDIHGDLFCQKPRNFRLRAELRVLGKPLADIGSNDREFWYWFSEDKPPDLYHCAYSDLSRGNVRLPLPLHPDWMLEALGVGAPAAVGTPEEEQARGRSLEVRKSKDNHYLYLIERTTSLQGQPVIKETVLNNFQATGTKPQVVAYRLYDGQNKLICKANVTKVQYDGKSGAVVPQRVEFEWPAMKLTMVMTLDKIAVNNPVQANNTKLFTRPQPRPGSREVDLAQGMPLMTPTGIQRAGAFR
jgi:hypothetical protein